MAMRVCLPMHPVPIQPPPPPPPPPLSPRPLVEMDAIWVCRADSMGQAEAMVGDTVQALALVALALAVAVGGDCCCC